MLVLRAKKLCLIKVNCRTMSDDDDYYTILGCGELSLYCNNDINNPATMQYINNYGPCHLSTLINQDKQNISQRSLIE